MLCSWPLAKPLCNYNVIKKLLCFLEYIFLVYIAHPYKHSTSFFCCLFVFLLHNYCNDLSNAVRMFIVYIFIECLLLGTYSTVHFFNVIIHIRITFIWVLLSLRGGITVEIYANIFCPLRHVYNMQMVSKDNLISFLSPHWQKSLHLLLMPRHLLYFVTSFMHFYHLSLNNHMIVIKFIFLDALRLWMSSYMNSTCTQSV